MKENVFKHIQVIFSDELIGRQNHWKTKVLPEHRHILALLRYHSKSTGAKYFLDHDGQLYEEKAVDGITSTAFIVNIPLHEPLREIDDDHPMWEAIVEIIRDIKFINQDFTST